MRLPPSPLSRTRRTWKISQPTLIEPKPNSLKYTCSKLSRCGLWGRHNAYPYHVFAVQSVVCVRGCSISAKSSAECVALYQPFSGAVRPHEPSTKDPRFRISGAELLLQGRCIRKHFNRSPWWARIVSPPTVPS